MLLSVESVLHSLPLFGDSLCGFCETLHRLQLEDTGSFKWKMRFFLFLFFVSLLSIIPLLVAAATTAPTTDLQLKETFLFSHFKCVYRHIFFILFFRFVLLVLFILFIQFSPDVTHVEESTETPAAIRHWSGLCHTRSPPHYQAGVPHPNPHPPTLPQHCFQPTVSVTLHQAPHHSATPSRPHPLT